MDKVLLFLIEIYVFIILHEMGHYLYCVVHRIQVKYLYIMPFEIFLKKRKLGIRFNFSYMGLVVLDIDNIDGENIKTIRKSMLGYTLAGPIVNVVCDIILIMISIKIGLVYELVCGLIINSYIVFICLGKNSNSLGDFYSYKSIKENDMYFWQQIYSVIRFGNISYSKESIDLVVDKLKNMFEDSLDFYIKKRVLLFIMEHKLKYLNYDISCVKERLNKLYNYYINDLHNIKSVLDIAVIGRLIQYIYIIEKDKKKAEKLFDKYKVGIPTNYIFEECYWMFEKREKPDAFIRKCLNKEYAMNYYLDEQLILENINTRKI